MNNCFNCKKTVQPDFKVCPYCGENLIDKKVCPKCNYENEANSKFCQECGVNLVGEKEKTIKPKPKVEVVELEPVPSTGITIEFPYSSSQSYDFAVKAAEKFESYQLSGEGKKVIHRVNVNDNEIESLDELIENLKGWRSRVVYVKGEKVQWDSVFNFIYCFNQRKQSFKPHLYCFGYESEWQFNMWGCLQSDLSFNENSELFTYGKWLNEKGDWQFDKERIKHKLQKNLFPYRFCPKINLELIGEVINAFPDRVNPTKDKDWKFVENWGGDEGLKVSIKEYGYSEEKYMKGVAPIKKEVLVKIISKKIRQKLPKGI